MVQYALELAPRGPGGLPDFCLCVSAVRAASLPVLQLLEARTGLTTRESSGMDVYGEAAGDRPTLRMLAQLRCDACDSHLALLALLEDPTVPLCELRWRLEGDGGGGDADADADEEQQDGSTGGSRRAGRSSKVAREARARVRMGPGGARMLYGDSGDWQGPSEAVRLRGEAGAQDAAEVNAWLEGWWEARRRGGGEPRGGGKRGTRS